MNPASARGVYTPAWKKPLSEAARRELAHESISDELAAAVELFNASTDPVERVELHNQIRELRAMLPPAFSTRGGY